MKALEAERKKKIPLSVLEKEDLEEKKKIRAKGTAPAWLVGAFFLYAAPPLPASYIRDEAIDDVKALNAMARYAKTVQIRDLQLKEKVRL